MRTLITILLISCGGWACADELRWGFATADGMPYVDVHEQQLRGGFIYQLGQLASQQLGFDAAFVETPNKRIDEFMQRGRIHVICNSNPQWIDKPERYHWSAPLYSEEDVLLLHREHAPITGLQELHGKTVGTQLGYVYNMSSCKHLPVSRSSARIFATTEQGLTCCVSSGWTRSSTCAAHCASKWPNTRIHHCRQTLG
ncbi:amino acid ABC transporter substrate-binding protein [Pseudomonas sp. WS 5011]|nr:amino acid ABC transporter substrate-binding protein [Pseudomonas sp. WS 5011]